MTKGTFGAILTLGLAAPLLAPSSTEAGHRHSRHCSHPPAYVQSHRHYAPPPAAYRYGHGYAGRGYYGREYPRHDERYRYSGHRHDRGCGHYAHDYGHAYRHGYGYEYDYGHAYRYVPPPPVRLHYHGRARCLRPHLSIHLGF